ncbi:NAD(P)-dependent dehydrogenase, short-chain alcohol dehydrogenase family [Paenibacillus sp. UNCCL117]|uniref:SDR family oxidoreductase n=1 Tax=unclassified Paenibacillus TaxID=185978 RepID=UPI0008867E82|nr:MULTISPECIES: SDR family oxidoreductase [unclassified Paenibacillus]SDD16204.1 NAD(P)-dependent dehydrogenase, short-chain alcohol dehydrogenase family [Paenibacillus sp. cl123]SFW34636.1 NAD(P)-dependent dehydrogenase, short-chain alcohol dehydrogenase family [Paenibacillus sp. UNCCL117]
MKTLQGKIALVTGASRGIGRAIAGRLAQEGAAVAVHFGKNRTAAEEVVREIQQNGGKAFSVEADLGSADGIQALYAAFDEALKQYTDGASFDILVNNAGIGLVASIEETTEAAFDEVIAINVKAPFFLIREALPRLRDGGRIVNLSSFVTRVSLPGIPAYSMSKGAIDALTLALAPQLGPRGITINAIQPGFVATDMNAAALHNPAARQSAAGFSVFGRWGEPADIADIAVFLASPASRWITGQCIDASGGSHL